MPRKGTSTKVSCVCAYCGATFLAFPSRVKQGAAEHCSRTCSGLTQRLGFADHFWRRVAKAPEAAGCWLWTGGTNNSGYGVAYGVDRRMTTAHRVAWELALAPIPDGMDLCHNCPSGDIKLCVRPDHMFVGSRQANMTDAEQKGQTARGERNRHAKLTDALVTEIRRRYDGGSVDCFRLAAEYSVSYALIRLVVTRKIWRHVP